jgi:hypothetical protein
LTDLCGVRVDFRDILLYSALVVVETTEHGGDFAMVKVILKHTGLKHIELHLKTPNYAH